MSVDPQAFGRLQAEVEQLQRQLLSMQQDLREALTILEQARGGWRVMVAVSGVSGVLGATLLKVGQWFLNSPPPH